MPSLLSIRGNLPDTSLLLPFRSFILSSSSRRYDITVSNYWNLIFREKREKIFLYHHFLRNDRGIIGVVWENGWWYKDGRYKRKLLLRINRLTNRFIVKYPSNWTSWKPIVRRSRPSGGNREKIEGIVSLWPIHGSKIEIWRQVTTRLTFFTVSPRLKTYKRGRLI